MIKITAKNLSCIATMAKLYLVDKDTKKIFKEEAEIAKAFQKEVWELTDDEDETLYIITNPFKD